MPDCFPKEKHQNSQKWAKFMNFSFCPFYGLVCRGDSLGKVSILGDLLVLSAPSAPKSRGSLRPWRRCLPLPSKSAIFKASRCAISLVSWKPGRGGGVKTYRTLEGGGTRPESCPSKLGLLTPKLAIFYRISVEKGQIQGPLKIQNFHPSNFRRFDPPPHPGLQVSKSR